MLGLAQQVVGHIGNGVVFVKLLFGGYYVAQLVQKPLVYLGKVVYLVDTVTLFERLRYIEYAFVGGVG